MKKKGCLITVAVVLAIIFIFGIIIQIVDPSVRANQTPKDYADLSSTVQVFADKMLVKQLKYPDGWEYEYNKLIRNDSTKYTFQAVVLAKNGFGVRSRLTYLLQMEFIGSKDESKDFKETGNISKWKILRNDLE